jgi:uncharacterized phiE125 gp8 family phage protein
MDWQVTSAPFHEPISLAQAKRHLRIDGDDSDRLIEGFIAVARRWVEHYTGRALLWQTITARRDDLDQMPLPRPPLIAVSSIAYVDTAGATQTLSPSIYDVDVTSEPGRIVLAYDQSWPSVRGQHHDVTVTFIAGHAAACTRSGNTLLVPSHLFAVNDPVQVYNLGGALPAGLSAQTTYYVTSVSGHAVALAATEGGEAVPITDAGTGAHYIDAVPSHYASGLLLAVTDLWVHRGDERPEPSRQLRELLSAGRMVSL